MQRRSFASGLSSSRDISNTRPIRSLICFTYMPCRRSASATSSSLSSASPFVTTDVVEESTVLGTPGEQPTQPSSLDKFAQCASDQLGSPTSLHSWRLAPDNRYRGAHASPPQYFQCSHSLASAAPLTSTYEYDAQHRVHKAIYDTDTYVIYSYDLNGNLTTSELTDLNAPTPAATLTAARAMHTTASVSWTASGDSVGVTSYQIERCTGASCTNFLQITTRTTTTHSDTGLTAGIAYR